MKVNAEQEAKLARIKNPQQRELLLHAIEHGLLVPDYAWEPFPVEFDMTTAFGQMSEILDQTANEAGVSADEVQSAAFLEFEQEQVVLRAQSTATAASHFLCDPFALDKPVESQAQGIKLLCWGYFNPKGPTVCELKLEILASRDAALLIIYRFHPFSPSGAVYGCCPLKVASNRNAVVKSVGSLFASNGSAEEPLLSDIPSYVFVAEDSPLTLSTVRPMFASLLADTSSDDLGRSCDLMKRHWCNPWKRASEELLDAVASATASMESKAAKASWQARQMTKEAVFAQWWTLVTDADHVDAEMREIPAAWRGAKAYVRGDFDSA